MPGQQNDYTCSGQWNTTQVVCYADIIPGENLKFAVP